MKYPVQKGIPIPPPTTRPRAGRKPIYPFARLEVGDRFVVPHMTAINQIRGCIGNARGRFHHEYQARVTPEGVRVWRVK